jgi:hypothetical protein
MCGSIPLTFQLTNATELWLDVFVGFGNSKDAK